MNSKTFSIIESNLKRIRDVYGISHIEDASSLYPYFTDGCPLSDLDYVNSQINLKKVFSSAIPSILARNLQRGKNNTAKLIYDATEELRKLNGLSFDDALAISTIFARVVGCEVDNFSIPSQEIENSSPNLSNSSNSSNSSNLSKIQNQQRILRANKASENGSTSKNKISLDIPHDFVKVEGKFSLYLLNHPVTQAEYERIIGKNPARFRTDPNSPVESLSFDEALEYCNRRSERDGFEKCYTKNSLGDWIWDCSKNGYRLPTYYEWSWAARGGNKGRGRKFAGSDNLDDVAYYENNSHFSTQPVMKKKPNELGLYDMLGNVYEWCWDGNASERLVCGGSYRTGEEYCKASAYDSRSPVAHDDVGFRLALNLDVDLDAFVFVKADYGLVRTNKYNYTGSGFYICKRPVTQADYKSIIGRNPSYFKYKKNGALPVERISFADALEYCNKRSEREGLECCYYSNAGEWFCDFSKNGYRLPTCFEWRLAAKGGNESNSLIYAGSGNVDEVAWYCDNSGRETHIVGKKGANELGIFDMSGNVWEWCWDVDETSSVPKRFACGGAWDEDLSDCNVNRAEGKEIAYIYPNVGFRVVRSFKK